MKKARMKLRAMHQSKINAPFSAGEQAFSEFEAYLVRLVKPYFRCVLGVVLIDGEFLKTHRLSKKSIKEFSTNQQKTAVFSSRD